MANKSNKSIKILTDNESDNSLSDVEKRKPKTKVEKKSSSSSSEEETPKIKPKKTKVEKKSSSSSSEEETPKIKPSKTSLESGKIRNPSTFLYSDKELEQKRKDASTVSVKNKGLLRTISAKKMSEIPPYVITGLQVDILRSDVLKAISVGSVIEPKEDRDGGINDPIAGALDENKICTSCGEDNLNCVGHMRYIQLPDELKFVPGAILNNVAMILRCICKYCSGLLVTKVYMKQTELLDYNGKDRLKKLAEECVNSNIKCQRYKGSMEGTFSPLKKDPTNKITKECLQNPIYKVNPTFIQCIDQSAKQKSKGGKSNLNEQNEQPIRLTMFELEKIFANVSPEDKVLMGFPSDYNFMDFIVDRIPVIPPNARPQIFRDGESKIDHYTFVLNKLVEIVSEYNHKSVKDGNTKLDTMNMLQHYYDHIVDNSDESLKRNQNEVIRSVKPAITGKDGIIRGSSMGKRVNHSARTVVGPDSRLKFGQIGVPEENRGELTVPEKVTKYNINKLQKLYEEGKIKNITFGPHPRGEKLEGRSLRANIVKSYISKLAIGDEVDRFGEDGDEGLVGRQPTLHKEGLQCYKRVYGPNSNFRLHMCNTAGHNADFDGDEMTEHGLQTIGARVEGRHIASAEENIMDSQKSKTMPGLTYNHPASLYMMTQMGDEEVIFTEEEIEEATSILTYTKDFDTIQQRLREQGVNPLSGRALFSYILPAGFCYRGKKTTRKVKTKLEDGTVVETELDTTVIIDDGILVSGVITKSHVGSTHNSIVHYLWITYDKDRTSAFLTDGTFLADWFMGNVGFSIGQYDCMAPNPEEIEKAVENEIVKTQLSIYSLGPETSTMTKAEKKLREDKIRVFTNSAPTIGKKIAQEQLPITNALNIMSDSGSKGNHINTGSIMAAVGQQYIKGERPRMEMDNNRRCLPYYAPNSIRLEARGMILESYMVGITPGGTIYHAMASRVATIATATMTGTTGFIHHRIAKALESVMVSHDGSVSNCTGACFQLVCADGMESGRLMSCKIDGMENVYIFIDVNNTVRNYNLAMSKKIKELGLKEKARNVVIEEKVPPVKKTKSKKDLSPEPEVAKKPTSVKKTKKDLSPEPEVAKKPTPKTKGKIVISSDSD